MEKPAGFPRSKNINRAIVQFAHQNVYASLASEEVRAMVDSVNRRDWYLQECLFTSGKKRAARYWLTNRYIVTRNNRERAILARPRRILRDWPN